MKKPVIVSVSLIPNLLQHVLVGIGVGRFHDMVNPAYREEVNSWVQCDIRSKFTHEFQKIEGVSSSTWFALLYQIPAYLADDNVDSLLDILDMLSTDAPIEVISRFPEKARLVQEYIPSHAFHHYVGFEGDPPSKWSDVLADFTEAVRSGYECSYEEKWKEIKPKLEEIGTNLNESYFADFDWIEWWERRTGIEFPYPCFNIELIDTTTTQGTSLLAERDGFYAHSEPLMIATVVSHEICTHLLYNRQMIENELTAPLIKKDLERYLRTAEILSWATNHEVISEQGLSWVMENSFDWLGEAKDDVAAVINRDSPYPNLMVKGFERMK